MMRRALLVWSFLLAGFSSAANAKQLAQGTGEAQRYTLEGTVVDSVTGAAVPGALVEAFLGGQKATRADAAGKFLFSGVPSGTVAFNARKPGYFSLQEIQPASPVRLTVGPNSGDTPIVLKLTPEGIIYGRISEANGEPAEGMQVQILTYQTEGGKRTRIQVSGAVTDDEGKFRVALLREGRYFVLAGPQRGIDAQNGAVDATAEELGYEFYPGVADFSAATAVNIRPGTHAEVNFKLPREASHKISGTVVGLIGGDAGVQLWSAGGFSVGVFAADGKTGKFEIAGIPVGKYQLFAQAQDGARMLTASQTVELDGDLSGVRLALQPAVDVAVSVRVESAGGAVKPVNNSGGNAAPFPRETGPSASVVLMMEEAGPYALQFPAQPAANGGDTGAMSIPNVIAGNYALRVSTSSGYYVASARSGAVDLLNQNLSITGDTPPAVEIVLRDDGAGLAVTVRDGDTRGEGRVVLWQEGASKMTQEQGTDTGGMVRFSDLAPGVYRLLAFPLGSNPEYESAEFAQRFAAQEKEIALGARESAAVSVELVRTPE
jgi:carboxypeptidase family protein